MRLIRDKRVSAMEIGEKLNVAKLSEPEFLLWAQDNISTLLAEAVSTQDPNKFADLIEIVNSCCNIVNIDWYECSRLKSSRRWEEGSYDNHLAIVDL
tara:strand:+ start:655 stop:945 length:291 start_codon:yes stop_codon:yes gene_type:complete